MGQIRRNKTARRTTSKRRLQRRKGEGPAGRIARLAYEQALRDGRSEAEAYYYAIRIKKICDELSEDDADAVLQDIELNHQNNFLEYFLMDKDVYAVNDTEGDPNRGDKMTVQKTDFEYFMLRHLKNDFRMEDMGKLFWALGEFSKTMYMFFAGMITFNALLAYATRIVEYMNVQNYVNNMDSNLTVSQQQTIRENVLKSIEESKKIRDASNFDKHIQLDKELAEKIAQQNNQKPYANSRPNYGENQVDEVWNNAMDPETGIVLDPTGVEIVWDKTKPRNGQWDMGHIPGQKYSEVHKLYMDGVISKEEFLEWYRDPKNYRPELPKTNRGHQYE